MSSHKHCDKTGLCHRCRVRGAEHPPCGGGVVSDQQERASTGPRNNMHSAVRQARRCEGACSYRDHEVLHITIGGMISECDLGTHARDERGLLDERSCSVRRSMFGPYRGQHPTCGAGTSVLEPVARDIGGCEEPPTTAICAGLLRRPGVPPARHADLDGGISFRQGPPGEQATGAQRPS